MNSCGDPLCQSCKQLTSNNVGQDLQQQVCLPCVGGGDPGTPPFFDIGECALSFIEAIGVCTDINTETNITTLYAPSGSLVIDTTRLSNSWNTVNKQLPNGSIEGYLSSVLSSVGSPVATDIASLVGVIIGVILVQGFILYTIIFILLMTHKIIGVAEGIVFIIIALLIIGISIGIIYIEALNYRTKIQNALSGVGTDVFNTLACAFGAGVCCYSGGPCSCSTFGCTCENEPYPPGFIPPCGTMCPSPPPCGAK